MSESNGELRKLSDQIRSEYERKIKEAKEECLAAVEKVAHHLEKLRSDYHDMDKKVSERLVAGDGQFENIRGLVEQLKGDADKLTTLANKLKNLERDLKSPLYKNKWVWIAFAALVVALILSGGLDVKQAIEVWKAF